MLRFIFALVSFIFYTNASAQRSVIINEDPQVTRIMDLYLSINKSITHVAGWRITVITTTDRRLMEQTRASFQQQFSMKSKWEYNEPYYYLKAGAFVSRADASFSLETIKKKFSSAFLSSDKISYDEF